MAVFDYERIADLREHHPILRMITAINLPLIAGFLHKTFVEAHRREIPQVELEALLDDYLCTLPARHEGGADYRRSARGYLDEWSRPDLPFLRKFYVAHGDEPVYDLTPATERALQWLQDLEQPEFVGTESRLTTVFGLLRDLVHEGDESPEERLQRLLQEREQLDAAIAQAQRGEIDPPDETRLRERFLRLQEAVRQLLADFRQVEENLRQLDRNTRSKITLSELAKGSVLDEIFGQQDAIAESDEGRSFRAFWELLLNSHQQRELRVLLGRVLALPALEKLDKDPLLSRLLARLSRAGEQVNRTLSRLNEQLRKFLDDRLWVENRRVAELARSIERHALALRDESVPDGMVRLDDTAPQIDKLMSRRLYTPPADSQLDDVSPVQGESDAALDALFEQSFIDLAALRATIDRILQSRSQVTLSEIIQLAPPRAGIAELIGYLKLASDDSAACIDDAKEETMELQLAGGQWRRVKLPQVIFTR